MNERISWENIRRQFSLADLRWSYIAIGVFIVIGAVVNLLLPNGWTIWPFVFAAGVLTMMHEAADRNASGIPPLYVYGFVAGAVITWIGVVMIFTAVNPLILVLGMLALAYYAAKDHIKQKQRMELMAGRAMEGLCIHCGEPVDATLAYCPECGLEPNPDESRLKRVASTVSQAKRSQHMREVLSRKGNKKSTGPRRK
jgi:hypothetical protein